MLTIHVSTERGLQALSGPPGDDLPPNAVWIDLNQPTREEEVLVERWLGVEVPTREEMREIEVSSRLYEEDGALVMTALALVGADTDNPGTTDVAFILIGQHLITVRYADPRPFVQYLQRAPKVGPACRHGDFVLLGLIEAFIDRIADVLEHCGADADKISVEIFRHPGGKPMRTKDFKEIVTRIGHIGELASKARESLVTLSRLLVFISSVAGGIKLSKEVKTHLKTALRDANQLSDHASYLANKTVFLLEATMGMINIEQNNIIKIFSVASVALMPPTLIASIYGMNFTHMPELEIPWAYPAVLCVMVFSSIVPYLYFRRKGWL